MVDVARWQSADIGARTGQMSLTFEWDEQKAEQNLRKHQVSFEEAKTIFGDPFSITIPDPEHSASESRYVDIGYSSQGQLLVVVYTER
jgi:uncharacterized DUF497 family protein